MPGRPDDKTAVRRYKTFHGNAPSRRSSIGLTVPRAVTYLGDVFAIEYESTKKLAGSHRLRLYRHKVGRGVKMYLHPDGKTLIIRGGRFRVTDWLRG